MSNTDYLTLLESVMGQRNVTISDTLQTLWNEQGACVRFHTPLQGEDLVAKIITPKRTTAHPKGWSGETSYQRKCRSYEVEQAFYTHYQPLLDDSIATASMRALGQFDYATVIILDDLDSRGFFLRKQALASVEDALGVIHWLAKFHATFVQSNAQHLWPQGTYWHLKTRTDEWHAMPDNDLKQAAEQLDGIIHTSRFKTLVHGDAKVANFCFAESGDVAAVDFQYVGAGIGVQDLAYFIGSAFDERQQIEFSPVLIDAYFDVLATSLAGTLDDTDICHLVEEWRDKYAIVNADFQRFLSGWNPTHWKLNSELNRYTNLALGQLKQGTFDV